MRTTNLFTLSLLALFVVAPIQSSFGDFTTFTDRSAWEAAAGTLDFLEDFEGFTADEDFSFGSTSSPNGFTVGHSGNENFRNLIDVPPLDFNDGNGTASISAFVEFGGKDTITITPDDFLTAFGFETSQAAESEGVLASFFDQNGNVLASVILGNGIDDFVGVTASNGMLIGGVEFIALNDFPGGAGEGFRLDNFGGAVVPEPSTIFVLATCSLAMARRRRA